MKKNIGYKVTNSDMTCRDFQYEIGKTYSHTGKIGLCTAGFHFCLHAADCFNYYSFDSKNKVFEIQYGEEVEHGEDKSVSNKITFLREIPWSEVLEIVNSGKNNSGLRNSGNWNSGDSNSGNWNSGNWNSGDSNSGNWNSGYWNSGDRNSGDSNSGYWNSGDRNSGDRNSGYRNSGNWNSGYWNSGYRNSGDRNSGYRNSGNWNSGDSNSGNWNSGNWNSGDRNSGDSNSGYRNSGAFCTEENPILYLFDKPTTLTVREWENSEAIRIMSNIDPTIWVPSSIMSSEEKNNNPKWETTEGYLKTISIHEAWANIWGNLSEDKKELFLKLPNFDAEKFEKITGIKTQ